MKEGDCCNNDKDQNKANDTNSKEKQQEEKQQEVNDSEIKKADADVLSDELSNLKIQEGLEDGGELEGRDENIGRREEEEEESEEEESDEDEEDETSSSVTLTPQILAKWLKSKSKKRIVVLSGAGVSVAAGIPDFRTPGTGLYDNLQKYNLPDPQAIFDISFYRTNPHPFIMLANELWPGSLSPTLTHAFIHLLQKKGILLRNYTQNIDGLEILAGVDEERVVECHGHFRTASCIECENPYEVDECKRKIVEDREAPKCGDCGGYVKPDIVFFGQGLPERFGNLLKVDLEKADLLLVIGTSLSVTPVSMIPEMVDCPRVLINREWVGGIGVRGDHAAHDVDHGVMYMDYRANRNDDLFMGGDCDDMVEELCRLAGWEDELRQVHAEVQVEDE